MSVPTPTIEAARAELALLLRERASRVRRAVVGCGLLGGLGLLAVAMVGDGNPVSWAGGTGFLGMALIVGAGLIPISGRGSHYRQDRIMYLQAYVAAHDASAENPPVPRVPRSRPRSLPATVETIDTIRQVPRDVPGTVPDRRI